MISVTCTINKGDFPLTIKWTLNEKPVETIGGISVMKTNKRISQLSIESIQAGHSGKYTCIASNLAGNASHSSFLNVNGTFYIFLIHGSCFSMI